VLGVYCVICVAGRRRQCAHSSAGWWGRRCSRHALGSLCQ